MFNRVKTLAKATENLTEIVEHLEDNVVRDIDTRVDELEDIVDGLEEQVDELKDSLDSIKTYQFRLKELEKLVAAMMKYFGVYAKRVYQDDGFEVIKEEPTI